jgi:hypothetical protein
MSERKTNIIITVLVLSVVFAFVCHVFNWKPWETTQTIEASGAVTVGPDYIVHTKHGTSKPVTTHYGPASNPVITPTGLGTSTTTFRWSGFTFQPWIGAAYAGRNVEPMAGVGVLFVVRDLVEFGPVAGPKRAGAGAWWRRNALGLGGGVAWPWDGGKPGAFVSVSVQPWMF